MERRISLWKVQASAFFRSRDIRAGYAKPLSRIKDECSRGLYPAEVALDDSPFSRAA